MAYYDGYLNFNTKIDDSGMLTGLKKLRSLASNGGVAVGAALTTGIAASVKSGMEFESAFAGVRKTVDATEAQLASMRKEILDMSNEIPIAATEIAGIAEAAGQLGIKTENIASFTRTMADLGVATNMTSEQAATSLARMANITQMPQENFDRLGSSVVALGNNLATTESEVVDMALRLAGTGKQIGMSEANIVSFAGALSSVGISAEAGGTAFSKLMADMQLATATGNEDLQKFAAVADVSATEFQKAFQQDAAGAIISFIKGLSRAEQKGTTAIQILDDMGISEIRLRDSLLRAAGASDVFSDALQIGNKAWEENTALSKEAEQRYDTVDSKLQLLKNGLVNMGIAVYDGIQEPFKRSIETATTQINELTNSISDGELQGAVADIGELFGGLVSGAVEITETALPAVIHLTSAIGEHSGVILTAVGAVVGYKAALSGLAATQEIITWGKAVSGTITAIKDAKMLGITYSTLYQAAILKDEAALKMCNAAGLTDITVKGGQVTATNAATGATLTFNKALMANPVGMVVGAIGLLVGGLTAGYIALSKSSAWLTEEEKKQREEMKKLSEESTALANAQRDLMNAQEERMRSIRDNAAAELSEIDYAQQLFYKLTDLADETGRVDEENRALASFILGELNNALGTQYTMTGNQIDRYTDMKNSIEGVIEKDQARIALGAYSDILTEALKTEAEAKRKAAEASENLAAAETNINSIVEEFRSKFSKANGEMLSYDDAVRQLQSDIQPLSPTIRELSKRYKEQSQAVEDNRAVIEQAGQSIIKSEEAKMQYQDAAVANAEGNFAKVNSAALLSAEQRKTIENSSASELADAVIKNGEEITRLEKEKNNARTEEERKGWEMLLSLAREYGSQLAIKMAETGALSADGIATGLISPDKLEKVKAAIKKVTDLIPDWAKKLMGIHSPSRVMRDEVGAQIVAGIAVGINENGSLVTDAMERLSSDILESELSYLEEKARIEAENAAEDEKKREKQYREQLYNAKDAAEREEIMEEERLRKKKAADDAYLAQLKETADAERKIIDDLKKDITNLYDDIADRAEKNIDEVVKNRESFAEKLKDYANPYTEKTTTFKGLGEHGEDLVYTDVLLDLSEPRKQLEEYANLLRKVEQMEIIPRDMFKLLRDLPIDDAVKYADALLSASDSDLAAYVEDWTAIQRFSEDAGEALFGEDMKKAADDTAQYMKEALEKAGFEVPEGFFTSGSISAEKFGDGFVNGLDEVMSNIREKLKTIMSEFQSASIRMGWSMVPEFAASPVSGGTTYNNTTYNLLSSGESVRQQIQAIDAAETVKKMRGM